MNRAVVRTLVVSVALSCLGLAWVIFRVGSLQDLLLIRRLPLGMALAALAALAAFFALNAYRLQLMCARLGHRLSFLLALRAHVVGMFSATITPGGAGATPAIALALQATGVPGTRAWAVGVAVFGADSLFHAWGLPIALAVLYALHLYPPSTLWFLLGVTSVVLAAAIAIIVQFRLAWLEPIARAMLRGPLIRWRRRGLRFVETMIESHTVFSNAPLRYYLGLQLVTAAAWLAFFSILYFLARGIGLDVSLLAAEAAQVVVSVMSIFVPTPGGSGFFELGISYVLLAAKNADALPGSVPAVVLLWRVVTYYSIFLLGPLFGGGLLARAFPGGGGPPTDPPASVGLVDRQEPNEPSESASVGP